MPRLYLHASKSVESDFNHMTAMTDVLSKRKFDYYMDIQNYRTHTDLAKYFPEFAFKSIEQELIEK